MSPDIKQWCQDCELCQVGKDSRLGPHSFMGHLLVSRHNKTVAIDFTVLEPSIYELENVLILTDAFSKYTVTWDQWAATMAQILINESFFKFRVLSYINSDQERCFENSLIQQLCVLYGVAKSCSTWLVTDSASILRGLSITFNTLCQIHGRGTGHFAFRRSFSAITPRPIKELVSPHFS